jgi:uncharacterized protein YdeI (YjbR/CyaY-like superfamily)
MSNAVPQVDGYIRKHARWAGPLQKLRVIVLGCGLTEQIKWRVPVYTVGNRNVVFLNAFKEWCAISFTKGVLLKDPKGILLKPGEESQSTRTIRFTSVDEITRLEPAVKRFVTEAVAVEKSGVKVPMKEITDRAVPAELQKKLDEMPALKKAFQSLTPGRQRQYLMHVASAKQSTTREARVEKHVARILAGKGLNDGDE